MTPSCFMTPGTLAHPKKLSNRKLSARQMIHITHLSQLFFSWLLRKPLRMADKSGRSHNMISLGKSVNSRSLMLSFAPLPFSTSHISTIHIHYHPEPSRSHSIPGTERVFNIYWIKHQFKWNFHLSVKSYICLYTSATFWNMTHLRKFCNKVVSSIANLPEV